MLGVDLRITAMDGSHQVQVSGGHREDHLGAPAEATQPVVTLLMDAPTDLSTDVGEGSKLSSSSFEFEFELARSPPKIFFHVSVE